MLGTLSLETRLDKRVAPVPAATLSSVNVSPEKHLSREEWQARTAVEGSDWGGLLDSHFAALAQLGLLELEPPSDPGWAKAARKYHASRGRRVLEVEHDWAEVSHLRHLLSDSVSFERAYRDITARHIRGRAANSTIEALVFGLRRGLAALDDPANRRRLALLDDAQAIEVGRRLRKLKPEIAPPWTADEVLIFMQMRERPK
jgi:hypothetical protein